MVDETYTTDWISFKLPICWNCGDKFKPYHKTSGLDKYCSVECRMQYHNNKRTEAMRAMRLRENRPRAELMNNINPADMDEWLKSAPKTKMALTKLQAERMNRLTAEQIEDKPSFISKPEPRLNKPSWQCTQCRDYFHSSPCPNCIDKSKQTDQKDMTLTPDGGIDDDPPY